MRGFLYCLHAVHLQPRGVEDVSALKPEKRPVVSSPLFDVAGWGSCVSPPGNGWRSLSYRQPAT